MANSVFFALYFVQINAVISSTSAQNAKWPLGQEKPFVVKTMQVFVSLVDAGE
jgi:hypothetical protein